MGYDMSVHLPRQVELFLESINVKNNELYDQTLDSIKELIDDDKFLKGLNDYDNNMEDRNKQIEKDTLKTIQDPNKTKNLDDVISTLNQGMKDVNENNVEYVKIIKTFILGWIKNIEKEEEQ